VVHGACAERDGGGDNLCRFDLLAQITRHLLRMIPNYREQRLKADETEYTTQTDQFD
jgi:hypothetical protein